ncbi:MAG: hypothetical protein AAF480_03505 [Actinomycetota bacterium]
MTSTWTRRLDPDALAALEEERAFLLRSLDDLEEEFAVGDIDDEDYETLKDDYTRRAAEVIRAVDEQRAAFRATKGIRGRQALVWLVGLALLGGLSGVLISRSSGARTEGESLTGGVRQSEITRLNEARRLFVDPDTWDDAIDIYDSVLEDNPSSVEALTYRAWLSYRLGDSADAALSAFDEVARIDAEYPDATVFETIVLADAGRYEEAADTLGTLDLASAPTDIALIVGQRGLAGEVFAEARRERIESIERPTLDDLDLTVDQALAAAGYLSSGVADSTGPVSVLKLYRAVRADDPTHPAASSREAWLLFQAGRPGADELLDAAVAANPSSAEPLFTRASIRLASDRRDDACADLLALLDLDDADPAFADAAAEFAQDFC